MSRRRTTPGSILTGAVRKCTSGCATPRPVHRRSAAECDADVGPSAGTASLRRPQALLAAIDWLGLAASVPHSALAFVPAMAAPFVVGRVAFWIGYRLTWPLQCRVWETVRRRGSGATHMDGLEFTEKIIGHLVTLAVGFAWPLVVVALFVTQRKAVGELIDRIKKITVGKEGVEADIESKRVDGQLNVVATNVAQVQPAAVQEQLPHTDPNVLAEAAKHLDEHLDAYDLLHSVTGSYSNTNPAVVIERAWADVEKVLYPIVEGEEQPAFTYVTGQDLFQRATSKKLFDRKLLEAIGGLLMIRNETITSIMDWQPTREQAAEYVRNVREVLRLLGPYLTAGLAKEPVEGERATSAGM